MDVAVLAHYSQTLDGIDWNMDEGAVYHAATRASATLCGYRSDAPPLREGASDKGWQFWGIDRRFCVTCKRCLRILEQGEREHEMSPAQRRRATRRETSRIKEAFDRQRDYLGEAQRNYRPTCLTEKPEYQTWRLIFAECAYELLRDTPSYKGFRNFTELDWSRVESGALSRMHYEYYRPLLEKEEAACSSL